MEHNLKDLRKQWEDRYKLVHPKPEPIKTNKFIFSIKILSAIGALLLTTFATAGAYLAANILFDITGALGLEDQFWPTAIGLLIFLIAIDGSMFILAINVSEKNFQENKETSLSKNWHLAGLVSVFILILVGGFTQLLIFLKYEVVGVGVFLFFMIFVPPVLLYISARTVASQMFKTTYLKTKAEGEWRERMNNSWTSSPEYKAIMAQVKSNLLPTTTQVDITPQLPAPKQESIPVAFAPFISKLVEREIQTKDEFLEFAQWEEAIPDGIVAEDLVPYLPVEKRAVDRWLQAARNGVEE